MESIMAVDRVTNVMTLHFMHDGHFIDCVESYL